MALYQKHIVGIDFTTVSIEDSPDMIHVWVSTSSNKVKTVWSQYSKRDKFL